MPYRTHVPVSGRSSDLTNVLFIGSHDQIVRAFDAAGWTQPGPPSLRDRIDWIRSVAELRGDGAAPMSVLLLDGAEPAMSWQKGLNDVAKRHHIRMWKAAGTWRGRETVGWSGYAGYRLRVYAAGKKLSHKIGEYIDQERDKVAYDLAFSSCGSILDWTDRPDFPRIARNATGDPIVTDGRMVAIELNDCPHPAALYRHRGFDAASRTRQQVPTLRAARNPERAGRIAAHQPVLADFRGQPLDCAIDSPRREHRTPDPELAQLLLSTAAVAMR